MRAFAAFLGLGALLLGVGVVLVGAGLVPPPRIETAAVLVQVDPTAIRNPLPWWVAGGFFFLVGCGLLLLAARAPGPEDAYFVLTERRSPLYGDSVVLLSQRAARALAAHAAEAVPGVRECEPYLSLGRKGWSVDARVSVRMTEPLPDLIPELQKAFRATLEHATGLPVDGIRIRSTFEPLGAGRDLR